MPSPYFLDQSKTIEEIIRVNHAGEFGAQRIYAGQIKYIKGENNKKIINEMLHQEMEHLEYFSNEIANNHYRPTILLPIWNYIGYISGVISATISPKTAMLVTEAVEEIIESHYDEQIIKLKQLNSHHDLLNTIEKFKADEADHRHIAIEYGSKEVAFKNILSIIIKKFCKIAIITSKKI